MLEIQIVSGLNLLEMTAIVVSPISDQLKCMNPMMNARKAPISGEAT